MAPTKKFKANIATRPNEEAAQPPMTISKATIDIKIQAQEETLESRPPPLEDAPIHAGTPWPDERKMLGNLFEARKDWLLPPNYIDDAKSTANTSSLKPPIKVEPKIEGQPSTSPKAEKCGWGPNCPFCKSKRKTVMVTTRNSPKHNCSPNRRSRSPKCSAPRPWVTRNPRASRNLTRRHLMLSTQVNQNSVSSGKKIWKDLMPNII